MKIQHQTRNGLLCSRSCTTQPRHILASKTENTRTGSTPTTSSYRLLWAKETKPTRECCKPGALDPPLQHTKMPADCYKNTPVHWSRTGGIGRQWSCRELLTVTTWRASTMGWRKCGDPKRRDLFNWNQQMEWRPSLTARFVARWSEHFQKLLNVPGDIDHEALDNIPQRIIKTSLDEIPTMDEMARAIAGLKDGKAPGGDGIPAEVWKHGGDNLFSRLHQLITNAWEMGSVPQAWKDASIVTIYKKGDRTDCGNYRGISLLSIAGKIFARILLNRLSTHITPEVVPETQCGFRGNRSTVDMIFCLRQLQEKCIEQDRPLYMVFVDFSKAIDTVGRTGLWQLLRKYGCPEKFTTMIEALHTGMMTNVSVGGEVSESFSVTNGVKQGCVLAPTLFSIFLSAMLDEAFRDMGMASTYSPDRALTFSTSPTSEQSPRLLGYWWRELLFADDSALVAHSAEEMQKIVDAFSDASKKFGLKINIKKTEVLYQSNSTRTREEDIMVDGNKLNSVLEFTYLGSTISSDGCIDDEIQRRMAKASASFGRLRQRLWNNHHVSMRVKGKIYRAIVLFTLLYGAEAWTVYRRQVKKLHAFMMRHLRSIMRITWMDKVTHKEILERTGLPSMEDLLIRKNLRWTGHLMRMSPDRLPKQVLYSQLSSGHRKRGRPRLRFKDTIKRNLKMRDIKIESWTSLSQQRDKWRATVKWWKQSLSLRDRQHDDDDGDTNMQCRWQASRPSIHIMAVCNLCLMDVKPGQRREKLVKQLDGCYTRTYWAAFTKHRTNYTVHAYGMGKRLL